MFKLEVLPLTKQLTCLCGNLWNRSLKVHCLSPAGVSSRRKLWSSTTPRPPWSPRRRCTVKAILHLVTSPCFSLSFAFCLHPPGPRPLALFSPSLYPSLTLLFCGFDLDRTLGALWLAGPSIAYCALPLAYPSSLRGCYHVHMRLCCVCVCVSTCFRRATQSMRAERIEYLLLHEFYARKYILPERAAVGHDGGNKTDASKKSRRKPAYSGGKVFEPKKGLYDTFVLLLDFNSLYPSIIRVRRCSAAHACVCALLRPASQEQQQQQQP